MPEPDKDEIQQRFQVHNEGERGTPDMLEAHIRRALHKQASQLHFTQAMQEQIMRNLPSRRLPATRRTFVPVLAVAAACILLLSLVTSLMVYTQTHHPQQVSTSSTITFVMDTTLSTPSQLAQGGQLVSLDPTRQHVVYAVAHEAGTLYTTDLAAPLTTNQLAMRDARDVAWAPDGSALVTTIFPTGTSTPLLALVPTGKYMHLLGEEALAASWLPTSSQEITYITETHGVATLSEITPDGLKHHVIGSMAMPLLPQHMSWSPDGRFLAIIATRADTLSQAGVQGPGQALYLFDTEHKQLTLAVSPANFSIGSVRWSTDARTIAYEKIDAQGHTSIHALDAAGHTQLFSLSLQHSLLGMNWSPDGRIFVYSDGGTLSAHVLHGASRTYFKVGTKAEYPFWLDNQHILYLSLTNGLGQLASLDEHVSTT